MKKQIKSKTQVPQSKPKPDSKPKSIPLRRDNPVAFNEQR